MYWNLRVSLEGLVTMEEVDGSGPRSGDGERTSQRLCLRIKLCNPCCALGVVLSLPVDEDALPSHKLHVLSCDVTVIVLYLFTVRVN